MYGIPYMESGLVCFLRKFIHADASEKEVSVNDMISQKIMHFVFTPENASHFTKRGGECDQ